jgi:hypothetical protein
LVGWVSVWSSGTKGSEEARRILFEFQTSRLEPLPNSSLADPDRDAKGFLQRLGAPVTGAAGMIWS